MPLRRSGPILITLLLIGALVAPASAHDGEHPEGGKPESGWPGSAKGQEVARAFLADSQPAQDLEAQSTTTCTDGSAAGYPCDDVDLLSFLPLGDIGGGNGNDIWGWTDANDPDGVREYAIMGRTSGTSFVDITNPESPVYLGNLPTTRFSSTWRDIKVYADHAFIVSEARNHGMQVFDLTRLRGLTGPVTFSADASYTGFTTAHNIAINEESGYAYAIGTNTCSGGLHIVDIRSPKSPVQAGCYSGDGYTHDVQCVNYAGPDTTLSGRELCFASNEDTLTIVDVTDKAAPALLSRKTYTGAGYTHQGWLTEDHGYFLIDDELDESNSGHPTHTYVWDVANLRDPVLISTYEAASTNLAIDHNQYIVGNHSYQANYRSGLRILDITNVASGSLAEVAYFDIYPADDAAEFNGAWSVYPFFGSGNVIVSGIEQGLYVLRPNLGADDASPTVDITSPPEGATVSGGITVTADASDDVAVAHVEFFVDGASIDVDTDGTNGWATPWDTTTVADGTRTLTATATDSTGQETSDSTSVTVDNVANSPPTASFGASCADLTCDFDGSASTDADGSIVTYAWDFGDEGTASGVTASHTYANAGTYAVTLTVTDDEGAANSDSQSVSPTEPSTATMHIGDLDGSRELKGKSGRWEAFVTITVHDAADTAVIEGATVSGSWSGALTGTASGTTGSDGTVTVSTGVLSTGDSVTFTITGVTHSILTYDATDNHDPDGSSDGTTVTVTRP